MVAGGHNWGAVKKISKATNTSEENFFILISWFQGVPELVWANKMGVSKNGMYTKMAIGNMMLNPMNRAR